LRILYLTDQYMDYLSDEVLYGLRALLGQEVVDYPQKKLLYASERENIPRSMVWGNGATAFGLPDLEIDREDIEAKVRGSYFDLVINSNCWRIHTPLLKNLVVLDGQDHRYLNPLYLGRVTAYFKRELLWNVPHVQPIQFALPDHLLDTAPTPKTKLTHASFSVMPGLRQQIADVYGCQYIDDWKEYIRDINSSWYGISPKGAGYDCMRHYEILGRAVLCIYLDPGAPRILREAFIDGVNCLVFRSVDELKFKIGTCADPQRLLDQGRRSLLTNHLATQRAEQVLKTLHSLTGQSRSYHFYSSVRYGYLPYYAFRVQESALDTVHRLLRSVSSVGPTKND